MKFKTYISNETNFDIEEVTLKELEEIAKKAYRHKDGWVYDPDNETIESTNGGGVCFVYPHGNLRTEILHKEGWSNADAKFIATFNPELVMQLLEIIKNSDIKD